MIVAIVCIVTIGEGGLETALFLFYCEQKEPYGCCSDITIKKKKEYEYWRSQRICEGVGGAGGNVFCVTCALGGIDCDEVEHGSAVEAGAVELEGGVSYGI